MVGRLVPQQGAAATGDALDDTFRLWFMDNADHTPPPTTYGERPPRRATRASCSRRCSTSTPGSHDGVARPPSAYEVDDDNQIELADCHRAIRGGVQPVVGLSVSAGEDCDSRNGRGERGSGRRRSVTLAVSRSPPRTRAGTVRVEWDFEGTGEYPDQSKPTRPARQSIVHHPHLRFAGHLLRGRPRHVRAGRQHQRALRPGIEFGPGRVVAT